MATLSNNLFAAAAADGSHRIFTGSHQDRPDHRNGQSVARIRRLSFVIADLAGIWAGAALGLAAYFKFCVPGTQAPHLPYVTANLGSALLYSALIALFCNTQRLYAVYQSSSSVRELLAIVKAISMASLLLTASIYISGLQGVSRVVIGTTMICSAITMTGWRRLRRSYLKKAYADGLACQNVLIVGTDDLARAVKRNLESERQLGFVVLGYVATEKHVDEPHVLGTVGELSALCRKHFVDEVVVCAQNRNTVKRVITEARACGVGVRVIPDLYDGLAWGAHLDYLGSFPSLAVHHRHIPAIGLKLKRALDFLSSALALLFVSPIMIALAVLVKLDSRGPVLYVSRRVGRKGRIFACYKFRTMVSDAEKLKAKLQHLNERDGVLFKITNDPRITRLGRYLRKYSLDELPQLFNVLKGDMSLVGPRPPLANEVAQYEIEHLRRLEVAPGITGLWQVEARTSPSFDRYIELDLNYVEQWSLMMDIRILLKTVAVVFAGTGQ